MTLVQMGISGACMIAVAAVFRALLIQRLPKRVFLLLWGVILVRLLVPFSISSPFSIYGLLPQKGIWGEEGLNDRETSREAKTWQEIREASGNPEAGESVEHAEEWQELSGISGNPEDAKSAELSFEESGQTLGASAGLEDAEGGQKPGTGQGERAGKSSGIGGLFFREAFRRLVWLLGACMAGVYFCVSYIRCLREFRTALPVEEETAQWWLGEHLTADGRTPGFWHRRVCVRCLDHLRTPLTYGIFRPVILVPKDMDWSDRKASSYILEHEWVHICRLDAVFKLALALAVCVHWMNPLVWLLYCLANRDLELSCDEAVLLKLGEGEKSSYARMLISMEEKKSGLLPLYSGFGKNAIEERITAIMKLHRTSVGALLAAGVLILCVGTVFATSATQDSSQASLRQALTQIPGDEFTREESQKLFDLWVDGYEDMTVAAYQEQLWKMTDSGEYGRLIDRFAQAELVYELPEGQEADALNAFTDYFFHVFSPLTAERWQSRDFGDSLMMSPEGTVDPAVLEYILTLQIKDRDTLTVGSYEAAQPAVHEALSQFLQDRTREELEDQTEMEKLLEQEKQRLVQELDTGQLSLSLSLFYMAPTVDDSSLYAQISEEIRQGWEETLKPYLPFGLTYTCEEDENGEYVILYYQGKEVGGIWDPKAQVWITDHTGTGQYTHRYAPDAPELIAVYEKGSLSGLRQASPEEQRQWDEMREENSRQGRLVEQARTRAEEEAKAEEEDARAEEEARAKEEEIRAARETMPGTREDYDSLLKLQTGDYEQLSLADFNDRLLDWCNEDSERMERVAEDVFLEDYRVSLTEEEKDFVSKTFPLSREENYRMITSLQTNKPEEAAVVGGRNYNRQEEGSGSWCRFYYEFSYEIRDRSRVTVGERDRIVGGLEDALRQFWEETDFKELLSMEEEQVVEYMQDLAEQYSTEQVKLSVDPEHVVLEHRPE